MVKGVFDVHSSIFHYHSSTFFSKKSVGTEAGRGDAHCLFEKAGKIGRVVILHHFRFCASRVGSPLLGLGAGGGKCTKPKVVQYKAGLVGYLLDGQVGRAEQFLCFYQMVLLDVKGNGKPRFLFDQMGAVGITDVEAWCKMGGQEGVVGIFFFDDGICFFQEIISRGILGVLARASMCSAVIRN